MRAVAIALVLLYHAGVPFFGGGYVGVNVFFVLSGYLITGVMLRDVDRTGRLSLTRFWARRARRLLPAAFVALGAASMITWLWLPLTQRSVFGKDIFSAAIYLVNWRLAGRSVDYLAEDIGQSPVQHFWSLAVEEQFYIVWPLVIVATLLIARCSKMSARTGTSITIVAGGSCLLGVVNHPNQHQSDRCLLLDVHPFLGDRIGCGCRLGCGVSGSTPGSCTCGDWLGRIGRSCRIGDVVHGINAFPLVPGPPSDRRSRIACDLGPSGSSRISSRPA